MSKTGWKLATSALVVLAIAVIGISQVRLHRDTAQPETQVTLEVLSALLEDFRNSTGRYPSETEGVAAMTNLAPHESRRQKLTRDGWGNLILYRLQNTRPQIYSAGPNGRDEAGKGDDLVAPAAGRT